MQDHRAKLEIPGIATWALNGPQGPVEFISDYDYVPDVKGNLWKYFEGASRRSQFLDPQRRFVLVDAQDEVLRGDARTGELTTVVTIDRQQNGGLRRSRFVSDPVPIFVFENGLVVFQEDGQLSWFHDDFPLTDFFQGVVENRVVYLSEHRGKMAYDLCTGHAVSADDGESIRSRIRSLFRF